MPKLPSLLPMWSLLKTWYFRRLELHDDHPRRLYMLRADMLSRTGSIQGIRKCVICEAHRAHYEFDMNDPPPVPTHDCRTTRCVPCASARLAAYEGFKWLTPYPPPHACEEA